MVLDANISLSGVNSVFLSNNKRGYNLSDDTFRMSRQDEGKIIPNGSGVDQVLEEHKNGRTYLCLHFTETKFVGFLMLKISFK